MIEPGQTSGSEMMSGCDFVYHAALSRRVHGLVEGSEPPGRPALRGLIKVSGLSSDIQK